MSISRRSRGEAAPTERIPAETFAQVAGEYEAEWSRRRGEVCLRCAGRGYHAVGVFVASHRSDATRESYCSCPAGDRMRAADEASAMQLYGEAL